MRLQDHVPRKYVRRRYPEEKLRKNIAYKVGQLQVKAGLLPKHFAAYLEMPHTNLKKLLRGEGISMSTAVFIAEKTGCGLYWLLGMNPDGTWEDGYVHSESSENKENVVE